MTGRIRHDDLASASGVAPFGLWAGADIDSLSIVRPYGLTSQVLGDSQLASDHRDDRGSEALDGEFWKSLVP